MKKVIRLSLLMMLLPLLFLNVYAEESSIDNDSTQNTEEVVSEKTKTQEVMDLLPEEYSLDNQEEDYFIENENQDKTVVEEAIENEIGTILENNNIDKDSVQVIVTRNNNENSTKAFYITLFDSNTQEELEKEITVSYKSSPIDEETRKQVEELLKDKEKIELMNSTDFYTLDPIGETVSLDDYARNTLSNELINCYYQYSITGDAYFFSTTEEGIIYVFVNGTLYKAIPSTESTNTIIKVTEDLKEDFVLEEARQVVNDFLVTKVPENGLKYGEDSYVLSTDNQTNFGQLIMETVPKTDYEYLEGANSESLVTNPNVSVRVNGEHNKIYGVFVNGQEVAKDNYVLSENNQITMNQNYLKALNPGKYSFVVKYADGEAKTTFTLKEERVEPPKKEEPKPVRVRHSYNNYYQVNNIVEEEKEEESKVEEVKQEEEKKLEEEKEVSKDKKKTTPAPTLPVKEKEEEKSKKEFNFTPIVMVIMALLLGGLGFVMYTKSREEE